VLPADEIEHLYLEARDIDLDVVVEVHADHELDTALNIGAEVLGINNRNLDDFSVDVQTTFELMPDVPAGKTVVSESGIAYSDQLSELSEIGVDAVLIGESLMRADDPEAAVSNLIAGEAPTSEHRL
jgi:indole-3-glycerol phosphate synthase